MAPLPSAGKPTSAEGTSGCRETDGALQPGPWACLNLPSPGPEVMETSSNPFPGVLFKGRQA